jgi:hypothetical protein
MDPTTGTTPLYLDKGFLALLLTPILGILNSKFHLSLDASELLAMALPIVAYILGHKWKTTQIVKANIEAGKASTSTLALAGAGPDQAAAALGAVK